MEISNLKESYGTLSETVNGLVQSGYTLDFNVKDDCIVCQQQNVVLPPDEFKIDKVYRFEGPSNPDDAAIVYAISSAKFNVKGVLVDGYGITADPDSAKLVEKLRTHNPKRSVTTGVATKSNESTSQRPEGDRVIDASMITLDPAKFIEQIRSESTWASSDRNAITIFKSSTMRIVLMGLHENAELKPHKANGVISVQVLEGKIRFTAEQESSVLESGQIVVLHENIMHSVQALKESFFMITLAMKE